jgi:hypothetical protein
MCTGVLVMGRADFPWVMRRPLQRAGASPGRAAGYERIGEDEKLTLCRGRCVEAQVSTSIHVKRVTLRFPTSTP